MVSRYQSQTTTHPEGEYPPRTTFHNSFTTSTWLGTGYEG